MPLISASHVNTKISQYRVEDGDAFSMRNDGWRTDGIHHPLHKGVQGKYDPQGIIRILEYHMKNMKK